MRILFYLWTIQAFAAFNLTWGTPALNLHSNPPMGDTDSNAYIAMDPMGNAVATWSRTIGKGASENIWAAYYNHSQRIWTGAVKISGRGSASNSQVAIDEEGNAMFVWEEGFPTRIHYRIFSKEGLWISDLSQSAEVIHPSKNGQSLPQISIDSKGDALVIWAEFSSGKNRIFSAKKPKGMPWVDLDQISSEGQDAALIPSKALVLNEAGIGIAVWQEFNGHFFEIYAMRFVDGHWQEPLAVSREKEAKSPSAGVDALGNAVIVWSQGHAIFSKTLMGGILSRAPLMISHPAFIAERPHVGVDAAGNAVVVFERYNTMHKFIAGAALPKGANAWTAPIDLSGPSPSDAAAAGYPIFAMNAIGDGVAIWKEWTGSNMVIQGAGFSLGTWSSIKTLSSFSGDSGAKVPAYDISVALNQAGNILAVWPESPQGVGSQQIKATAGVGLANMGPMPPIAHPMTLIGGIVTGKQELHRFPAHADFINILTWESPGNVAYFNIYRGSLSSLVAQTQNPHFEDHQRIPKQKETYLITSVDQNGQESGPMTIVVQPR